MSNPYITEYKPTAIIPKYDGGYQLGGNNGLKIMVANKPIWLHRKMMKWCLGWEWIDN